MIRRFMPKRATKRGAERTPLTGDCDVLVCGASFAGLAVARELAGSGARTLIVDRYEVGERQTSACGHPHRVDGAHGPGARHPPDVPPARWSIPRTGQSAGACRSRSRPSTTATPARCCASRPPTRGSKPPRWRGSTAAAARATATERSRSKPTAVTCAPRWWWTRWAGGACWAPATPCSHRRHTCREAWRSIPPAAAATWSCGSTAATWPRGTRGRFPAGDELRVGVGSFEPRHHVKDQTVQLAGDLGVDAVRYQGNWIPHKIRPATEDGVFFAGDSAGHCLPTTAEGIRTALYFGLALGRELRAVVEGTSSRQTRHCAATTPSAPRTPGSSPACCACRTSFPACRPAPSWRFCVQWGAGASPTGRSAITSRSPRRRSPPRRAGPRPNRRRWPPT